MVSIKIVRAPGCGNTHRASARYKNHAPPGDFFCRKLLLFSGQTFVMQCTWMTFDLTEVVDAHITDMENSSFYDSWYQKEQFDNNLVKIVGF